MNLKDVRGLLIDGDAFQSMLLVQMLHGLGMNEIKARNTAEEARSDLERQEFEICICDADLPDMPSLDLLRWIRRLPQPKKVLPILVLMGYSDFSRVTAFRDAGAHLVMKKPASPQTLYDRIAWMSRPGRDFVECDSYIGPDRRFKSIGPPGGIPRRATDLSTEVGAAMEPNMSQDEIDSMMRPMRIQDI